MTNKTLEEQITDIKSTANLENPESYSYKNKVIVGLSINALSVIRQLQEENKKLKEGIKKRRITTNKDKRKTLRSDLVFVPFFIFLIGGIIVNFIDK